MVLEATALLKQFESIEEMSQSFQTNMQNLTPDTYSEFETICFACVDRVSGKVGPYSAQVREAAEFSLKLGDHTNRNVAHWNQYKRVLGVVMALKRDVQAGYIQSIQEIVHSDLFSDFLEAAEHLLEEGYKDAAAVMIGGVLEQHLHELCAKNGIDLEYTAHDGSRRPKKAETLNSDLTSGSIYGKNEQKQVTAWLAIRNDAAHAQYGKYDKMQVEMMSMWVRDFVSRYPA